MQYLHPTWTAWHITFGTYGTRLHGGERPTADRQHNRPVLGYIMKDAGREHRERMRMAAPPVILAEHQQQWIQDRSEGICSDLGWHFRISAAGPDHVHLLCDADPQIHGKVIRRLFKRELSKLMTGKWPLQAKAGWWAEGGSTKAIHNEDYLEAVYEYIRRQRA